MKKNQEFKAAAEGMLLPFLLTCYGNKSRNYVKGILKRGQVTVDGKVCTDHARVLSAGQRVAVRSGKALSGNEMRLPVIYEDDELIVINKPAGMLAVSTDKECENTAYHIVTEHMKSRSKRGRVFIVHRLDRETSGVMLLAKSESVKRTLQENWNDIVIRRGYIALVEGEVLASEGRITSRLSQTKTLLVYSSDHQGRGKPAVTDYRALRTAINYSLLDISIRTGRKNQIRVHMSDMGHPVAGDKKYGALTDPIGRLGLHASVLIVRHPVSGEQMRFESPPPGAFDNAF